MVLDLRIYNTLTRSKEKFKPLESGKIKFYQCGPTVYWTQHIGNMRAVVCADFIIRTLKYLDYDVKFVRNYTDVGHLTSDEDEGEDKMEKAARREKLSPQEIAEKYIKIYENDTRELNIIEPSVKPKASEHIQEMIEIIQVLMDKEYAYKTDLAVYFDVSAAKDYTKLSKQILEETVVGAGKGEVADAEKRNPADFALWFFRKGKHEKALQYWLSPWGDGFPGWHIECSAMAKKYLGATMDIHMGGVEHISIHHTNEIAQSESANNAPLANYWIHNEHLAVDGRKMAKSEGTGYSLEEIKAKKFSPLDLRYFFTQAHYRSKQNFTWEAMESARNGLKHLYNQIKNLGDESGNINEEYNNKFIEKISDDFNIPQAFATAQELLKADLPDKDKLATILDFDKVLGLKLVDALATAEAPKEVVELAEEREKYRQEKNWEKSDELRAKIRGFDYEIEDAEKGYILKKI
jgi:cysteinyl-tRNA synthetase